MLQGVPPEATRSVALLGPTNTGKTHKAVERMLEHDSGMIGLPLRLLAREIYDRVSARIGEDRVALVTGEEKRVPARPDYWVCTTEAMPLTREVDFVAVDEVQLATHDERGHIFTDRLLNARGRRETWFMGAATMAGVVQRLVPAAQQQQHPRLSRLSYAGSSKLSRLPPRSAVVAFSLKELYAVAGRLCSLRGGVSLVMGALSPRARNAQVALFQSGEVDYLVATDAVGMGLNLDVGHVAFASLRKFDGERPRALDAAENRSK
ncbi:MAG: helicase-related protein [Polyangiaceae bacterium]